MKKECESREAALPGSSKCVFEPEDALPVSSANTVAAAMEAAFSITASLAPPTKTPKAVFLPCLTRLGVTVEFAVRTLAAAGGLSSLGDPNECPSWAQVVEDASEAIWNTALPIIQVFFHSFTPSLLHFILSFFHSFFSTY